MLAPGHTAELAIAVNVVREVVAMRWEERRSGVTDLPSLLRRPLEAPGGDVLPARTSYGSSGPLAGLIEACELDEPDALLVAAALAPALDESFGPLYASLSDLADHPPWLSPVVGSTLAARTLAGRLAARERLAPDAKLRSLGLLRVAEPGGPGSVPRVMLEDEIESALLGLSEHRRDFSSDFPATPLVTVHGLDDVIVGPSVAKQLRSLLSRIRVESIVVDKWGFGAHHDHARGIVALFHGPPGTGKTMAAAALAREAGLPAYRIDLSGLVSKYIGETEKNLARVFDYAERHRCVLVFDEADAVFGSRAEVRDARDRYANQEVSYLLQRIEDHPGVVLLATNLLANIDTAFMRRVHVRVEFASPGRSERERIWAAAIPPATPLDDDVDLPALAKAFDLTGAEIREATFDAAFLAADDGCQVTHGRLVDGVRLRFTHKGRTMRPPDR